MQTQAFDRELDVRGLNCPLPILRAKKALGDLTAGQVLKVLATDPGSVKDFQAFCKRCARTWGEPHFHLSARPPMGTTVVHNLDGGEALRGETRAPSRLPCLVAGTRA